MREGASSSCLSSHQPVTLSTIEKRVTSKDPPISLLTCSLRYLTESCSGERAACERKE